MEGTVSGGVATGAVMVYIERGGALILCLSSCKIEEAKKDEEEENLEGSHGCYWFMVCNL